MMMRESSCEGGSRLSPLAPPFTIDRSSSRSLPLLNLGTYDFAPCASDGSFLDVQAGDFSFLSSGDHSVAGESVEQGSLKFSKSALSSAARLEESWNQPSLALPAMPTRNFKTDAIPVEKCSAHLFSSSVPGYSGTTSLVNLVKANCGDNVAKGQLPYAEDKVACFNNMAEQSGEKNYDKCVTNKALDPLLLMTSKIRITCPDGFNNKKLDLHDADARGHFNFEKSNVPSDQNESDVDSPCWKGTQSYMTVVTAVSSEQSSDELNGGYGLNPLAPHFVPFNSKHYIEKHVKDYDGVGSSPLYGTESSTIALSSGHNKLFDPIKALKDPSEMSSVVKDYCSGELQESREASILPHNLDRSFGPSSQASDSKAVSIQQSSNEFQISNRLNPLAPLFLPGNAKQTSAVCEQQICGHDMIGFQTKTSLPVAFSSIDSRILNCVKAETRSSEVSNIIRKQRSDTWPNSEVRIFKNLSLEAGNAKSHTSNELNLLVPQYSFSCTKENTDGSEEKCIAYNVSPLKETASSATSFIHGDHRVIDVTRARSQPSPLVMQRSNGTRAPQVECVLPNKSYGSSVLMSSKPILLEDYSMSNSWLGMKPNATLPMEDILETECSVSENALTSSSSREALSGLSQVHDCPSKITPPEVDVKKLLMTMHELSELLILVPGFSYEPDSSNEHKHALVKNIMKNLNLYIRNTPEKLTMTDPNHSALYGGPRQPADSDKDIANSSLQGNHQAGEEINPQALLYRSLWLKAESARCMAEYEASVSHRRKE